MLIQSNCSSKHFHVATRVTLFGRTNLFPTYPQSASTSYDSEASECPRTELFKLGVVGGEWSTDTNY